jgi:hypothetical protein
MRLDRLLANQKLPRDLRVRVTIGDQLQHLQLALGQVWLCPPLARDSLLGRRDSRYW